MLIVSRFGSSTRGSAQDLRDRLLSLGAPVLGVVGNAYSESKRGAYGYGYGRGYDYEPSAEHSRQTRAETQDTTV